MGLQRLFKLSVKKSASVFFVNHIAKSVALKTTVRMPTNLGPLRNATPQWLIHAVSYLNGNLSPYSPTPETYPIGRNAWAKCIAGEWNLSYDCITSIAALNAWNQMSEDFQKLVKGDMECDLEKEIAEDNEEATDGVDDVDISLDIVRQHQESGLDLPIGYEGGINAREGLVFNDPDDPSYDSEEEMQDILQWEG